MKERALKKANDLYTQHIPVDEIAFTIRRLVEELDKKGKPVAWMNPSQVLHGVIDARTYCLNGFIPLYTTPQTKPLSDEEILAFAVGELDCVDEEHIKRFARAIEERHGIK